MKGFLAVDIPFAAIAGCVIQLTVPIKWPHALARPTIIEMRTILNPDSPEAHELSPYQVLSRREIISLLRAMSEQKQLVSMVINGTDSVLTSILEVDDEQNTLYIDCAPNASLNRRIVESDNISFETVLDHIRILFFASDINECVHDNLPALYMPIPTSLIRLQRREYYRVQTPISNPVRCSIPVPREDGVDIVTVNLQNVSGGGIAVIDDKKLLDNTLGLVYKDCKIHLPGNTTVVTSLQVRNSQDVSLNNGKSVRRIGCLFVELPPSMLSAIQRYITKLEREQNAKSNGLLK
jgi:c-di-GMP-binding flagellar brake protein YcgR